MYAVTLPLRELSIKFVQFRTTAAAVAAPQGVVMRQNRGSWGRPEFALVRPCSPQILMQPLSWLLLRPAGPILKRGDRNDGHQQEIWVVACPRHGTVADGLMGGVTRPAIE